MTQAVSALCKSQHEGQKISTSNQDFIAEEVIDIAEEVSTESVQTESYHREVQPTAGEVISRDIAIEEDVADFINEILEEVPDIISENSSPEEIHRMAQKALSAMSSQDVPSAGDKTYIGNSREEKSPPLSNNSIQYIVERGVYKLLPTPEQWQDFPTILHCAKSLGAEEVGAFKVFIPEGVASRNLVGPHDTLTQKGCHFSVERMRNGTFKVGRDELEVDVQTDYCPTDTSSAEALVERFETLFTNHTQGAFKDVYYCGDIDIRERTSRAKLGLPMESPIWPLKGDRLIETRRRIAGIHWPFAYLAGPAFGAPFAIHCEDHRLHSINYLYTGQPKVWIIIAPAHARRLEGKLRATNRSYYQASCEQFVRHSATYLLRSTLDAWGISFKVICQLPNEAVVTLPQSYHQGFNAGYNLAEAVNYADSNWNILGYRDCDKLHCPAGFIHSEKMRLRNTDEDQEEEESNASGFESEYVSSVDEPATTLKKGEKKRKRQPHESKEKNKSGSTNRQQCSSEYQSWKEYETQHNKALKRLNRQSPSYVRSQPSQVFMEFLACNIGGPPSSAEANLLTRLLVSIASPDAFCQLRDAYAVIRENQSPTLPQIGGNVTQTIRSLEALDVAASMGSILRRYQLAHLVCLREERERKFASQLAQERCAQKVMPKRAAKRLKPNDEASEDSEGHYRSAASLALKDLMTEAYPMLKPSKQTNGKAHDAYSKKLKALKNRLSTGRNWCLLQQRFHNGILALIPTDGEFEIKNAE